MQSKIITSPQSAMPISSSTFYFPALFPKSEEMNTEVWECSAAEQLAAPIASKKPFTAILQVFALMPSCFITARSTAFNSRKPPALFIKMQVFNPI